MAATSDTLIELMAAGRLEQADAVAAARPESYAVALRAMVRMRQGRVAQVATDLRGRAVSQPWMVAPLVDALVERGELDEAQRVLPQERDWPETLGFSFLLDSLARLRLAQGRAGEALRVARECARRQRSSGIRNPGVLAWGSTLATALAATGRTSEALDVCDEQIKLAGEFGAAREHGMGLLALGRITGEVETLESAVAVLADSPARLEHARALAALGAATGEPERLRAADEAAERCGATALLS